MIQAVRTLSLSKVPGVAETLDWAAALVALNTSHLNQEVLAETRGCFIKDEGDLRRFEAEAGGDLLKEMLSQA